MPGATAAGAVRRYGLTPGRFGMGCGVSGAATASLVQKTGGRGRTGSANWSLGRIRGRDANLCTDRRAEAACRRQMPGPIRRDCPLRTHGQVVYTAYTPVSQDAGATCGLKAERTAERGASAAQTLRRAKKRAFLPTRINSIPRRSIRSWIPSVRLQGTSNNPWISILNDTIRHLCVEDLRNSLLLRAIFALI